jgi:hypothetical protein
MKVIKKICTSKDSMGFVVIEESLTKEQTIITMPADRFLKFSRKFENTEGQQVEVANGWVFPVNNQTEKNRN